MSSERRSICANDIAQALETWADPSFAASYDNVGLHVGSPTSVVTRVLIALDLTPAVLDEAIQKEASMILTHHPLLFRAPSSIRDDDFIGRLILQLARENITLYSIHTNLDAAPKGVSFGFAEILGLQNVTFLSPNPDDRSGMGVIGHLSTPEPFPLFLERIHQRLNTPVLRYTGSAEARINKVAVCGGSGGSLIQSALNASADAYVTADLGYHRFFEIFGPDGQCRMALIDAGHYETEKHTEQLLCTWLSKQFPTVSFFHTDAPTNPINYSVN